MNVIIFVLSLSACVLCLTGRFVDASTSPESDITPEVSTQSFQETFAPVRRGKSRYKRTLEDLLGDSILMRGKGTGSNSKRLNNKGRPRGKATFGRRPSADTDSITFTTTTSTKTPLTTTDYCPNGCYHQGQFYCEPMPCHIRCVDAVRPPFGCCYECPNGPNCEYNGYIIPEGGNITLPTGEVVYCEYGDIFGGSVRVEAPPSESSTFSGTEEQTTTITPPKTSTRTPFTTTEYCPYGCYFQGQFYCEPLVCHIRCVDGERPPNGCCYECPNGPNCGYDGNIIPEGSSITLPTGEVVYCIYGDIYGGSVRVETP